RRWDRVAHQKVAGYLRAAELALEERQWSSALWFFDRLMAVDGPARAQILAGRGEALANLERWREAAQAFVQLCALPDAPTSAWDRLSLACHQAGDVAGRHA